MELEPQDRPQSVQEWLELFTSAEADYLSSERGVDYRKLRDLLKAGKWKEADGETSLLMLKATGREKEGWIDVESINNFPCKDLRTIDKLWVNYSNGRFGFSVQKRIWESIGGKPDAEQLTYLTFGEKVGWRLRDKWRDYEDLTFSRNALQGHFPARGLWDLNVGGGLWVSLLLGTSRLVCLVSRLEECNI
jgi:hypothetical protein